MPENRCNKCIAQNYELPWPQLHEPSFINSSVPLLAELAGAGPAVTVLSADCRLIRP